MSHFVLIHSPLVGPRTWSLVGDEMTRRGIDVAMPSLALAGAEVGEPPYWPEHARAVARAVEASGGDDVLVLVAHSGAGPALPAIRQALPGQVMGYVFVDAGIPRDGRSRFDLFESERAVRDFREDARDGLLPVWTDEDLRDEIPDDGLRASFVAELQPLPIGVYEEPLPVFDGWPDAPCGYLLFSRFYAGAAAEARRLGWRVEEMAGGHFHMLVDPAGVTDRILALGEAGRDRGAS
jgi:hypothetical protein